MTFSDLLQKLHAEQYTGPVVVHLSQGQPTAYEVPPPPQRIRLDVARVVVRRLTA